MNDWIETSPPDAWDDPLLSCLEILTQYWHCPATIESLRAGLPLKDNRLSPDLFIRAARRAGLAARLVRRPLGQIAPVLLPVVLLLKDRHACVWTSLDGDHARILLPESGHGETSLPLSDLAGMYAGAALFVKPRFQFDGRNDTLLVAEKNTWFWGTLARYRIVYGEVVLASLLVNIFTLASPLFTMNVYDRVVPNNAVETLWVLAIGVLVVSGFDLIIRTLRGYFLDTAGKMADVRMAGQLFQQVVGLRLANRPNSVGSVAKNLQEFEGVRDFFTSATLTSLIDLPFSLLFVWVVYLLGGPLVITSLVAIPLVAVTGLLLQIPLSRVVRQSVKESTQKHAVLVETLTGLETIKTLGAEGVVQRQWEQCVEVTAKSALSSRFISSVAINFSMFVQQFAAVAVVAHGVYLIRDGAMTMGALLACSILTGRALAPMSQVANILTRLQQSLASLTSLNHIMSLPVERPPDQHFLHRPTLIGSVVLDKVSFSYPGQKQWAVENLSLTIRSGERVAIIGRIGCGKSTLFKLILKLYEPQQGTVFVAGVDVQQIDPADLRRNIGLVPQEPMLFYGTLRSNMALSAPYVDDTVILQAAHVAGVDSFAIRHPMGFDMPIGEQGQGLSGGQKQAVAIARAILTRPFLLLMDEPTSSMDSGTESAFMERLRAFLPGRTLIVTTHKASLLALVERVVVMEEGRIIMDGPKDQVLAKLAEGGQRQTTVVSGGP